MKEIYFNSCLYSSFIYFFTSFIMSYYNEFYSVLFFILFITSIIFHSNYNNIYAKISDKMAIYLLVLYSIIILYKKKNKNLHKFALIILSFLLTIYLYYYGYLTNQYCYHENKYVANLYHSLMHIISAFGHILIILL